MMRKTATILVGAIALALTTAAEAQENDGLRARSVSRIVIDQQRERPRPRVIVQTRDGREEQSETFKKVVRVGSNGELDISNITGNIEIKRGGGSDATIDVVKVARARTVDEAKELLPLVKVEINERATRVEVRTMYPADQHIFNNRRNVNVQVHYTITTPAGTRVSARSISGNIRAADITGELSLITTSGNVEVVKGRRVAAAKSTSGMVSISDTESDTPLEAGSISGDITLHRVKASRLELSTISGKVHLQDVACDRLEAHSLSGDVEFSGALLKGGRYELNSHSGNVRLVVSGDTGYAVEANSWSGNVQSEVAMTGGVQNAGRGFRRKELRGVVGDGSAVIEITTFSGSVLITKR
jgi:predicted membrane protein